MARPIRISREYGHPVETVWKAITEREALAAWLMPNDFRLQVGHRFQFQAPPQPGFDGTVRCEVLAFEPLHHLSYTWQGGPMKRPTTVRWELEPTQSGTRLTLIHSGFSGLVDTVFTRFILGRGWRKLLRTAFPKYLTP